MANHGNIAMCIGGAASMATWDFAVPCVAKRKYCEL